jgi:hypothetical protein
LLRNCRDHHFHLCVLCDLCGFTSGTNEAGVIAFHRSAAHLPERPAVDPAYAHARSVINAQIVPIVARAIATTAKILFLTPVDSSATASETIPNGSNKEAADAHG